jgi:hypothetical protein
MAHAIESSKGVELEGLVNKDAGSSRPYAKRYNSQQSSGMETSVFRFQNVNFIVGQGDKRRYLLKDVSGIVRFGRKFMHRGV